MRIVSGSSNPQLAQNLAEKLGTSFVECRIAKFANGEKKIQISEEARGEDIILVQSFSKPVDEHVIETVLIADALERVGAKSVQLVIPWFGYSFQDKVFAPGQPLSAKVIAKVIESSWIHKIYLLDLHNINIPGFFSIPTYHLSAMQLFAAHIKTNYDLSNGLVISPDFGGMKRAREFADELGLGLEVVEKRRDSETGKIVSMKLENGVAGKTIFIFDDAILSGGTTIKVSKLLREQGAAAVHFFATHAVFTDNAVETLQDPSVDSVTVTNSIAQENNSGKIATLDISGLLMENLPKSA